MGINTHKEKEKEKDKDSSSHSFGKEGAGRKGFLEFWAAYPKKVGKGAAEKSWKRVAGDETLIVKILQAVEDQKKSEQWLKEGGQFIPHPATWLNQKRWEDELASLNPEAYSFEREMERRKKLNELSDALINR